MTSPRPAVVYNPSKISRDGLCDAFDRVDPDACAAARWYETTVEDPGRGPARDALDAGADLVIVAGGDGTVRAVAEVLAGTGIPLGIVPQGTGNLLARNLGVPIADVDAAIARALEAGDRRIDIGWIDIDGDDEDKRAFAVMVGFGLDARMLVETDEDLKDKAGWLAYVEALGRAVSASEVVAFDLALDDGDPERVEGHTLMIGNCGTIQGGVALLPDAAVDDGRLDLLLVSADTVTGWLDTVRSFVWDNGVRRFFVKESDTVDSDTAQHRSATRMRVELPEPLPFEIDGEEVGDVQAFTVRVDAGALIVR
ncbi:diacylglycerol/lipid kinase family protein [Microbacterium thalassium]|uniref:Diacylglycerol kinase family enzyme n=1 Tax=Microbacterium thalassium TaxID=362649 RepID=A0A7X0FS89_9MICO|nr:diacylglycerol kinase family protein [Microbacterium thalassium]MBB6392772.1 diacylglycerol kinase family enzyme [Microbacterium thalassium]GLK22997.1 sphingosine kinase [Microbacterium thalassium]